MPLPLQELFRSHLCGYIEPFLQRLGNGRGQLTLPGWAEASNTERQIATVRELQRWRALVTTTVQAFTCRIPHSPDSSRAATGDPAPASYWRPMVYHRSTMWSINGI